VWKPKSAREHRAVLAARTQLPGGECRGTPFYILIVEIAACVSRYTERATSVAIARGEGSPRIVAGKWKGLGRRVGRAKARRHECYVRSIEEDRPIGSAGRQRGNPGGGLEMIDTRTG